MKYFTLLIFLLGFSTILMGKDYNILQVTIQANIRSDGTVQFTEERTYAFRGDYHWANYTLSRGDFEEISHITVRDRRQEYTHSDTHRAHTYETTANASELNIKWYFQAADESRTFTLRYRIHGALASGPTWTEFFWNFIGDRWKQETEDAEIRITLPDSVHRDSIYLWLRPPQLQARVDKAPNQLRIHGLDVPENVSLQVRTLFPRTILRNAGITAPDLTPDAIQQRENTYRRQWRQQDQRHSRLQSLGLAFSILSVLLGIMVWSGLYYVYGRRTRPDTSVPDMLYSPPSGERPAIVGWLVQHGAITGRHFLATLLDLARRGYLVIRGEQIHNPSARNHLWRFSIQLNSGIRRDAHSDCTEWEQELLSYVKERQSDGQVLLHQLTDQRTSVRRWFPAWARQVTTDAQSRELLEKKSKTGAWINGIAQGLMIIISIGVLVRTNSLWPVLPMLSGVVLLGGSRLIIRRTREGEKLYKRWNAFKKGIIQGNSDAFPRSSFDEMLVYSMTAAVPMKHISAWLRKLDLHPAHIPWLFVHSHSERVRIETAQVLEALLTTGLQTVSPPKTHSASRSVHNE